MIIGVSGKIQSGKGEFAKIAKEKFNAQVVSFAGALKEEVIEFLQYNKIPFTMLNIYGTGQDKEKLFMVPKEVIVPKELKDLLVKYGIIKKDGIYLSFRSILQWWGTEYRRSQDEDYWIKRALEKCKADNILFVIDDLRFENEATALLKAGSKLVRIERPNNPNKVSNSNHLSEISLDDWNEWHYIIENINEKSIKDYHDSCELVIKEILDVE